MRYTVTMDFYVYADTDEGAIKEAEECVNEISDKEDNQASLLEVHKTPFGELTAVKIK